MNVIKKLMLCSMIMSCTSSTILYTRFNEPRDCFCPNKTLMWGSIQFPKNVTVVPDIRIYYSGQRIKCETNQDLKRVTFAIPDEAHKTQFKILITDNLEFAAEYNVIKYLKVRENSPYKFYQVELARSNPVLCSLEQPFEHENNSQNPKMVWNVREYRNGLEKGRIPDDTVIICCKSSYVDHIEGTNASMLPTIKIRPDLLQLAGSEKKLHEIADELIISLLDYDTIHAAMHQEEVRPSTNPKTVLAITT